jgi:hypothetical protein
MGANPDSTAQTSALCAGGSAVNLRLFMVSVYRSKLESEQLVLFLSCSVICVIDPATLLLAPIATIPESNSGG